MKPRKILFLIAGAFFGISFWFGFQHLDRTLPTLILETFLCAAMALLLIEGSESIWKPLMTHALARRMQVVIVAAFGVVGGVLFQAIPAPEAKPSQLLRFTGYFGGFADFAVTHEGETIFVNAHADATADRVRALRSEDAWGMSCPSRPSDSITCLPVHIYLVPNDARGDVAIGVAHGFFFFRGYVSIV